MPWVVAPGPAKGRGAKPPCRRDHGDGPVPVRKRVTAWTETKPNGRGQRQEVSKATDKMQSESQAKPIEPMPPKA